MKSRSSHSAKRPTAKQDSFSTRSQTDWERVRREDGKPTAENPEFDVRHAVRVVVRRGLKPVPPKASISLRLDQDVLDWFKAQGPGYQTRMNSVLRAFKDASS
jgi:uncharacterized protein (DUF4415 family)